MASQKIETTPGADGLHITYCRICEALCGMAATVEKGRITKIVPDKDNPHTRGHICVKGPALADVAYDPDRVTTPLKRVGEPGEFVPVSWEEALADIATRLNHVIATHGIESFAMNSGNPPSMGWPSAMSVGLFQRATGCRKHFTPSSEDITTTVLATEAMYGTHAFIFPDLANCDHLLIFGSNPLVSHGSLLIAPRIKEDMEAIAARGRVIVIDPRRTETARKYEHVAVRPDSDVWLLGAMLQTIIAENLFAQDFIDRYCTGWPELKAALAWITPEVAEVECGVAAAQIRQMAMDFARTPRAAAMGRIGICRGSFSTLTNIFLNMLNVISGKFHAEGGVGWGYGASATDQQAAPLNAEARHKTGHTRVSGMSSVWGKYPSLSFLEEMQTPGAGQIKALMVIGANPVLSMPNGYRLHQGFAGLDLMVSLDLYMTETARHAHYILPVTTALEREDINQFFMNHMVRPFAQYVPAVIPPVGQARMEFDILQDLAQRMGLGDRFGDKNPMELADMGLRAASEGLTLEDLKAAPHGIMVERGRWAFNLEKRLGHADRKIHLWSDVAQSEIARLKGAPPRNPKALRFVNLRKLRSINSWMHNVEGLVRHQAPALLMHPDDALARNIGEGADVLLESQWGRLQAKAELTSDMAPGSVAYPHGWGHQGGWQRANALPGENVNLIAPDTPDMGEAISGMSYLEGFDVEVRPL